ncbi:MAG: metal ABC transporter ATP-binding protein [Patescibacteria group bacterium]
MSVTARPILSVRDLVVQFGSERVLNRISFDIEKGAIVAIIGPNGSGKTTLIRTILGLEKADEGEILVFDKSINEVRDRIGYVPQRFQFDKEFPMTVLEFLRLRSEKAREEKTLTHKLSEVGLRANIAHKRLGELSGGELQRVLIAQAIINSPDLLFMDEPNAGIDIAGEETLLDIIKRLNEHHGTTILFITHEIDIIARTFTQVICVNRELICHGAPKVALNEATLKRLFGTEANFYEHHRPHHH